MDWFGGLKRISFKAITGKLFDEEFENQISKAEFLWFSIET